MGAATAPAAIEPSVRALVRRLGDFVAANADAVLVGIVAFTLIMVALASQARPLDNSQESFAPTSAELDALHELQERFLDDDTLVLQVIVTTRDVDGEAHGPVLTPDGLAALEVVEGVLEEELGDVLVAQPGRPEVVSFATPLREAAAVQGLDLDALGAEQLQGLYGAALGFVPGAQAEFLERLVAGGDPASAPSGLVLATIDAGAYADAEDVALAQSEDQLAFAAALEAADVPEGLSLLPFSFEILRADDGSFLEEVQRLFAMAILVVLLVLAGVLRARRGPVLGVPGAIRRTAADTALGLGVVVLANVWVSGFQVVLGPDGLGVVGPPSPPTNIVSILLIALGVDYAIHLQGRYRDEVGRGAQPAVAVRRTGASVGSAILLGALTTAVGFLTNLTSPLAPIRDLGVLAAVGLVSAFVLTTTFLPAVRSLLDRRADRRGRLVREEIAPTDSQLLPRIALGIGRPALRHPRGVMAVGALVTLAGAAGALQLETEFDIAAFLPEGSVNQRAFEIVQEDFAGGLGESTQVLVTGDVATTEAHNAQVDGLERLAASEAVVVTDGVVAGEAPPLALLRALQLAAAPDAPPPLVGAVDAATAAGLRPDGRIVGDAREVYAAFDGTGLLDGVLDLDAEVPAARWAIGTQAFRTGAPVVIADFDEALAPLREQGLDAVATGDLVINNQAIEALRRSQVRGLGVAFVVVLALLTVVYGRRFGRWDFGLLLMVPVAAVAICTLGLMWLTGIPFDPVTATVSALVIGVGIDFTIHLGERFVEDLGEAGGDPVVALEASIRHTGAALAGSALTTVLGFAVLTTASVTPFQRLGSTTVYAVALSLFAVVALQPAILLAWSRRRGEAQLAEIGARA